MTDQPASPQTAEPFEDDTPSSGRAFLIAFAFAIFAGFIAADFALGGKLTAGVAAALTGLRRREASE